MPNSAVFSFCLLLLQNVTVEVLDQNDPPVFISLPASVTVPENGALDAVIGELSVRDQDVGQTHTFLIQSQNPVGALKVANRNQLLLADGDVIDFETLRFVKVTLIVTDSATNNASHVQTLDIPVQDQNEAPTMVTLDNHEVMENSPEGALVANINVDDPDTFQQSFFCSLVEDSGGAFRVVRPHLRGQNQLVVDGQHLINFEKSRIRTVEIECMDDGGLTAAHRFQIAVLNGNDAPSAIVFFQGGHNLTNIEPPSDEALEDHNVQVTAVAIPENRGKLAFQAGYVIAYAHVVDEDNENLDLAQNTHDCVLISENEYKEEMVPRGMAL